MLGTVSIAGAVDVSKTMGSSVHMHVTRLCQDEVMVVSTMNMPAHKSPLCITVTLLPITSQVMFAMSLTRRLVSTWKLNLLKS